MKNNYEITNVKLVVSDFDGIFTDGKLCVYSDGKTSKTIDYHDIMGIAHLIKKNIKFAIISGEKSTAIDVLKEKFNSIEVFQNERNKIKILNELMEKYGISKENTAYIGDDINDTECLNSVKYPITVPNAHYLIKELPYIHITQHSGGNGAFREITDSIK